MIHYLVNHYQHWLESHGLGFFRVFTYVSFQAAASVVLAFLIVLFLAPAVIRWLRKQKIGDITKHDAAEVDALFSGKKGTPTMGGILIVASIFFSVLLLADLTNYFVRIGLFTLVIIAAVGAIDDWLKLTAGRRSGSRQGLYSLEKLAFQVGLAIVISYFVHRHGAAVPERNLFYFPFFKDLRFPLGLASFVLIGTIVLTGASNAVNLTDGLDGLASGCMAIVSFAFMVLAVILGNSELSRYLFFEPIQGSAQMAVLAGAMTGACLGFLWHNCNPAAVFMGDTGSLALGALIGYIALVIRQEVMLALMGGIFVLEAVSVMLQVGYFKYTKKRFGEGRRIFLMAPFHHHLQKKGWTENQVVVRFWLITAMLSAAALATVKLR
jgi:phospho-N-acetylmuramoyl-pentapeptide-transferase